MQKVEIVNKWRGRENFQTRLVSKTTGCNTVVQICSEGGSLNVLDFGILLDLPAESELVEDSVSFHRHGAFRSTPKHFILRSLTLYPCCQRGVLLVS